MVSPPWELEAKQQNRENLFCRLCFSTTRKAGAVAKQLTDLPKTSGQRPDFSGDIYDEQPVARNVRSSECFAMKLALNALTPQNHDEGIERWTHNGPQQTGRS
jgi:hypothetical protein